MGLILEREIRGISKKIEFKALVEKMCGYFIKTPCINRGGEFLSNQFDSFCKHHQIRRKFTIRRTHQQNGLVESKNQTIIEMERSMLNDKKLLNDY